MFRDAALFQLSTARTGAAVSSAVEAELGWFERLGLMLGASAFGAAIGFFTTLALGRIEPWLAPACSGPVYLAALYLAGERLHDAIVRKAWVATTLLTLHLAAMLAWPFALFLPAQEAAALVIGPPATLVTLIALTISVPIEPRAVNRASAHALFVAALAVSQALMFLLGS